MPAKGHRESLGLGSSAALKLISVFNFTCRDHMWYAKGMWWNVSSPGGRHWMQIRKTSH